MCSNSHKAKIHILIGELHIPEDHYRDMLAAFGVSSSADEKFTDALANELISALVKMQNDKGRAQISSDEITLDNIIKGFYRSAPRRGYATPGQMCKIVHLWWSVSTQKTDAEKQAALNHFLGNHWSVDRLEWLPIEFVGKVIKTLLVMKGQ
jgi:hypothetical protein